MSQRTLLIGALALMASGLLFGGLGLVLGGGPAESQQGVGQPGERGPAGGFGPGRPGFAPGFVPGHRPLPGIRKVIPSPSPSPTA